MHLQETKSTQSQTGVEAGRGGSCRGAQRGHLCSEELQQQSRPARRSPRPLSPARGAPTAAGRARPLTPAHPLGVAAPHLPAARSCLTARRARRRAHSRFLLPCRAARRRRFLPDESRGPAAPPAQRAGRPGRAGWAAGSARGRRPCQAEGRPAGAQAHRANQLGLLSLPRGPRERPGPCRPCARSSGGAPVHRLRRLGRLDVCRRADDRDRHPGAQEPRGPTRPGPASEDDSGACGEQDRWAARETEPPQEWLVGLWLGVNWEVK